MPRLMNDACGLLGNILQWMNALLCCRKFQLHFGNNIVQQCKKFWFCKEETMDVNGKWPYAMEDSMIIENHLQWIIAWRKGNIWCLLLSAMIALLFIFLMNLVLKNQSLEVYQAKDRGNNFITFNQDKMMKSLNQEYLRSKNHLELRCTKMELLCQQAILVLIKHMEEDNMQMLA